MTTSTPLVESARSSFSRAILCREQVERWPSARPQPTPATALDPVRSRREDELRPGRNCPQRQGASYFALKNPGSGRVWPGGRRFGVAPSAVGCSARSSGAPSDVLSAPGWPMFRTRAEQVSGWEAALPAEVLRLPEELARVDALLDDPAFFAPFAPFFHPRMGRPSTPMETYLRLMFLKFRYRLGYESLCREVADSISWRRFCRIRLDGRVPHPTTLMKLTTRCGPAAVDACNEALLAKAAEAKLLRTARLRADTTVVPADVAYPTDSGLLARSIRRIAATGRRIRAAGGVNRPGIDGGFQPRRMEV